MVAEQNLFGRSLSGGSNSPNSKRWSADEAAASSDGSLNMKSLGRSSNGSSKSPNSTRSFGDGAVTSLCWLAILI